MSAEHQALVDRLADKIIEKLAQSPGLVAAGAVRAGCNAQADYKCDADSFSCDKKFSCGDSGVFECTNKFKG